MYIPFQSPLPGSIQWNLKLSPTTLTGFLPFSPHYLGQYNETTSISGRKWRLTTSFSPHYLGQYNETVGLWPTTNTMGVLSVPITWVNTMKHIKFFWKSVYKLFQSPLPGSIQWNSGVLNHHHQYCVAFSPHYLGQYNETRAAGILLAKARQLSVPITWVNTMKLLNILPISLIHNSLSVPITWVNTMKLWGWAIIQVYDYTFSPHYLGQYNETMV